MGTAYLLGIHTLRTPSPSGHREQGPQGDLKRVASKSSSLVDNSLAEG